MRFLLIRALLLLASSTEICGEGVRKRKVETILGNWTVSRVLQHTQEPHQNRVHFVGTSSGAASDVSPASATNCSLTAGDVSGNSTVPLFDPCSGGAPKFTEICPNPFTPGFIYNPNSSVRRVTVIGCTSLHITGLVNTSTSTLTKLEIPTYGFREGPSTCKASRCACSWPGKTFVASSGRPLYVNWENNINPRGTTQSGGPPPQGPLLNDYLLTSTFGQSVVDTSLHWAYSLHGYENYNITQNGVPMITHVHGGYTKFQFDGNPEFFFTHNSAIVGPEWKDFLQPNGRIPQFVYDNSQPAALLFYHDHALGITRLNVYSGMAGFYVIRDDFDTGLPSNPLTLPTFPYETALAIQDRMFKANGELFYPAFPGDPGYADYITAAVRNITNPTVLTEFFGDFMLVNGKIWPKMDVEPRHYRLRLVNGCDSRFLIIRFCLATNSSSFDFSGGLGACNESTAIPFYMIGSDQGLRFDGLEAAPNFTTLVVEPGSRNDIVINFGALSDKRVIMANLGPDAPFDGTFVDPPVKNGTYLFTDRIMAFDVGREKNGIDLFNTSAFNAVSNSSANFGRARVPVPDAPTTRSVGLFEGLDDFGRLQPLLGTVYPAVDASNNPINWPNEGPYITAGLNGTQMNGAMGWNESTTELPVLNTTEYWDIWNLSVDAHPVHLHLVHFEVVARSVIVWDSNTTDESRICKDDNWIPNEADPNKNNYTACAGNGTYLVTQPLVQHMGAVSPFGGRRVVNPTMGDNVTTPPGYFENAPKDNVIALPNQVTRIKATFDKLGRFVWHCHILSHEDHEMMRIMEVVPRP